VAFGLVRLSLVRIEAQRRVNERGHVWPLLLWITNSVGDIAREAVKALIVANAFLETELEKLRVAASSGYARGQLLPRDRKD
jgi:hypothetical protein